MKLFTFLKALRFQEFFVLLKSSFVAFVCSFFFLSSGYGQGSFLLPSENSSPQSLLPLDDLIPNPPSESSIPDLTATIFEESDTAHAVYKNQTTRQQKETEITHLLKKLKFCANANEAKIISQQLQHLWAQSGSATIDLLMSWAENAINSDNYGLALDYIDNVLALSSTYAEAWVRRAWIHIQLSDFKLAMFDLNHALKLEPRNYIAFFELGITMEATERPHLAIKAYEMALHYYPQFHKIQKRIGILLEKESQRTL
ncbi:tetratricopeptide repeat protein [Bartonella sp. B41]